MITATDKKENCKSLEKGKFKQPPLFPQDELRSFVNYYFKRRDLYMGVIKKHNHPAYVLESAVLEKKARQFQNAFQSALPDVAFYYAVKSNNYEGVSEIMLQSGFGLDVSSGVELAMALKLGARDIVFSGPGKTDAELLMAVENSDHTTILIDSFGELNRLESIAASQNRYVRVGIRLTINATGLWRKFGITPERLPAFWQSTLYCPHIIFEGLQFHSSWNLNPDNQVNFIKSLGRIISDMPLGFKRALKFIDIGGGYWPPQGEWLHPAGTEEGILQAALGQEPEPASIHYRIPGTPIETFAHELGMAILEHILPVVDCRLCFEPGRWISNDAMHLMISVVDKKASDLVITDAGTNAIGWERFETDYFPVLNMTRPSLEEKPCHILGSLCTPHDVWGYSYWGEDIQPGDILMIPTQGAYTYSLRQNFIKALPKVIII